MDRADNGKEIDPTKWTIVCAEQGITNKSVMHNMNEAIEELRIISIHYGGKGYIQLLSEAFKMEVAAQGVTYDWTRSSLKKNGYIPWAAF